MINKLVAVPFSLALFAVVFFEANMRALRNCERALACVFALLMWAVDEDAELALQLLAYSIISIRRVCNKECVWKLDV